MVEGFGISLVEASASGPPGGGRRATAAFPTRSATARPACWWTRPAPAPGSPRCAGCWTTPSWPAHGRRRAGARWRRHYNWDRVAARRPPHRARSRRAAHGAPRLLDCSSCGPTCCSPTTSRRSAAASPGGWRSWPGGIPPGSLVVSTGLHPDAPDVDATFPNRVDRLPLPARKLRSTPGAAGLVPPGGHARPVGRRRVHLVRQHQARRLSGQVDDGAAGNALRGAAPRRRPADPAAPGAPVRAQASHGARRSSPRRRCWWPTAEWTRDRCLRLLGELDIEATPSIWCGWCRSAPTTSPSGPVSTPREVRERYGPGRGPLAPLVARLSRHKGIDTALHALALLAADHPDLRYAVVGVGEEHEALQEEARQLGMATGCAS